MPSLVCIPIQNKGDRPQDVARWREAEELTGVFGGSAGAFWPEVCERSVETFSQYRGPSLEDIRHAAALERGLEDVYWVGRYTRGGGLGVFRPLQVNCRRLGAITCPEFGLDASWQWLLNRSSLLLLSHLHQLLNNDDPPTHEARWSVALTKSAQARGLQVSAGGVTRGALRGCPRTYSTPAPGECSSLPVFSFPPSFPYTLLRPLIITRFSGLPTSPEPVKAYQLGDLFPE
ncbi:hypothetical protein FA13DRAFT_1711833 [Coprinellus micaceus]|uniref:Uncharacterized protein n=1 Tax=Coprinellus micaceus TaxID=71717 RepID=A0A4Y7T4Q9_COPMI|nr:hypothetical protein FA13DRAFT_1711833 [Coprinellus micaceus]